ncbi:MAG: hypothetical protein HC867_09785 [Bacteroidia bacterium]|nr:hypothetical protein [Bacteroidia bacterium]
MKKLLLISFLFLLFQTGNTQEMNTLLEKVKAKYNAVKDYGSGSPYENKCGIYKGTRRRYQSILQKPDKLKIKMSQVFLLFPGGR